MSEQWWTLSGDMLLEALKRCEAGESADLVYAELYANSEQEDFRDGEAAP